MKARVKWVGERSFLGEAGSGHTIALGRPQGEGSIAPGPSPMELMLIGTAGCSAFDVVHILEKGREAVEGCVAELEAERAAEVPKVFTRIHVHFVVTGRGLNREKVARAIQLSAEKYCSASLMLQKTAEITHDFEIVESVAE